MSDTHPSALITGCSDPTSLGSALALDLLGRGWKVYASAIDVESMENLLKAGCEVAIVFLHSAKTVTLTWVTGQVLVLDVTKPEDIQNALRKLLGIDWTCSLTT